MIKLIRNTILAACIFGSFSATAEVWVHNASSSSVSARNGLMQYYVNFYKPSDVSGIAAHFSSNNWFHIYVRSGDTESKTYGLYYESFTGNATYERMKEKLAAGKTSIVGLSSGNTNMWFIEEL